MDKKVVFITGAAKGIGAALAHEFAKNNYDLILHYYTSEEKIYRLKEQLEKEYSSSIFLVKADLSNEYEINEMMNNITNKFLKIDVLINNASLSMDCDIQEKTKEEFMKVLAVNLVAPFLLIKNLSPYLKGGTVINMSSTDADDTYNPISVDYCASKSGLNTLTKVCSDRFLDVRFFAVSPNWVKTEAVLEMNPSYLEEEMKRIGQERLIEPDYVALEVYNIVQNNEIKSGTIIRIEG